MEHRRVVVLAAFLAALAVFVAIAVSHPPWGSLTDRPNAYAAPEATVAQYLAASDRVRKAGLISRLKAPPQLVVFGGSRALRVDPAWIQQQTGLTGFNAAVSGARPEDAWAFLNLLHARFPHARFHFLWLIHADEFGQKPLDLGLLKDPALSRYFPRSLVKAQTRKALAHVTLDVTQRGRVFAPDGFAVKDYFDAHFRHPGDSRAVQANISQELRMYAGTPAALYPRSVRYFKKTLRLMDSVGAAPPLVVAAPVDARVLAATVGHGWGVRHQLLRGLIAGLHAQYRFSFLDLSRAAACGCVASDFYDGIHLTPAGARKVVAAALHRFPRSFSLAGKSLATAQKAG